MSVHMEILDSRESWLKARKLGSSDLAAAMGRSPHKSNFDLWMEKTGRKEPADLTEVDVVRYGTEAEKHLRELFALDFPDLRVFYIPNNIWTNDRWPHATASLDGWLYDKRFRLGVLEIKTALIQSARQKAVWDEGIPEHYYIQLLQNMAVTEADFGVLVAQLKWVRDGDVFKVTKHYWIEADSREDDMMSVMDAGAEFWRHVEEDIAPSTILPEI